MKRLKSVYRPAVGPRLLVQLNLSEEDFSIGADPSSTSVSCTFYDAVSSKRCDTSLDKDDFLRIMGISSVTDLPDSLSQTDLGHLFELFKEKLRECGMLPVNGNQGSATDDSLSYHTTKARLEFERSDYDGACRTCKRGVAAAREALHSMPDGASPEEAANYKGIVGDCYTIMGDSFDKLNKPIKAATCYALAVQSVPTLSTPRRSLAWVSVRMTEAAENAEDEEDEDPWGLRSIGDIEDMFSGHTVLSSPDSMGFSCTKCGSCCRSRDHIDLSPLDVFNISRAPPLSTHLLIPTMRLHRHPVFGKALMFGQTSSGYPTCQLRPKQSDSGRCAFSYPLFTFSAPQTSAKRLEEMSVEDTDEYLSFHEEHNAAVDSEGDDLWDELWQQRLEDLEIKFPEVEPIMNRSGQQALGCTLGVSSMPTLCASYPLVQEQDIVGEVAMEASEMETLTQALGDGIHQSATALSTSKMAKIDLSLQPYRESYVRVRSLECEGFTDQEDPNQGDDVDMYLKKNNLRQRWEDMQWFRSLRQKISQYLPCHTLCSAMRKPYLLALRRIWFDFDCLAHTRRPIRTYARLKAQIEEASWALARATKSMLQQRDPNDVVTADSYVEFVNSLNLIVQR